MAEEETRSARGRFGVSRDQWLAAALDVLERGGAEAVRVQSLAAILGVSKSGFYFHFADRDALMAAMLAHWADLERKPLDTLDTRDGAPPDAVADAPPVAPPIAPAIAPADALRRMAEIVDRDDLSRYDAAIRQWAKQDADVADLYAAKMQRRLDIARGLFRALGFEGTACEMRARTFVGFVSAERELFRDQSAAERSRLREARLRMLLSHH